LRNADAVVARFQADAADIPVDYEHATHIRAPLGLDAPAAGWIVEMQARDGALWARVEWTDDGAEQLRSRSYRYYSPAFLLDESGGIVGVPSVGLTNRPNLRVPALHRDGADTDPASIPGDPSAMLPTALCTALGIPETATEPEACAAVDALKADRATALHRAQTPDLALYVPRADYDAVLHRLREQEERAAAAAAAELSRQIEDLIAQGLTAARITPATVDYHRAAAAAPGGLERLQAFVDAAPAVLSPETRTGQPPAGTTALNADARAIMAAFGNTPETLARYEVTA
jgi:phage I-like protein